MNVRQRITVGVMDLALIVELCISMYFANLNPDSFTPVFFRYFFTMAVPTLVIAIILVKRLKAKEPQPAA